METGIYFRNRAKFREWLNKYHEQSEPVWIEFYKDGTESITYNEALEESLCFGWIDSLVKRVDERIYIQKFSRRKKGSKWSVRNRKITSDLIRRGLMTESGLRAIQEAKENGRWYAESTRVPRDDTVSFIKILGNEITHVAEYTALTDSLKKHYAGYYFNAKQDVTRKKRLEKIIEYMKTKKRIL